MSLLHQIQQAAKDLEMYKSPDLGDLQDKLNDLLSEADIGCIAGDRLDSIDVYDDEIYIQTSYSVRGCHDTNSYTLPTFIVEAEDPFRTAKLYGWDKRINHAKALRDNAQREMERYSSQYEKLLKEKEDFENKGSPLQKDAL